jgi:Raf kinase inhibitor-like YbhB/YbcL family protein
MKLTSPAFKHGTSIPKKHGYKFENSNPPLEIQDIPEGTKSVALIMDDPDVPHHIRKDCMWVHWVLYNIDPATKNIPENCDSVGVLGKNTGEESAYMGPCPPDREHRYFFKLYALDTKLPLKGTATKEELIVAMKGHILAEAELMGRYAP